MRLSQSISRGRLLVAVSLALLGLALLVLLPASVYARIEGCRSDPVVTLSNGDQLRIAVNVAAAPADVARMDYIVHAPPGVTLARVVYTAGGLFRNKEFITLVNDASLNHYATDALVTTSQAVNVGMTSTWTGTGYSGSAQGQSGQTLSVQLGP